MRVIDKSKFNFDRSIYNSDNYCTITNKKFWDGGFDKSASLKEKAEYYDLISQFSDIIKQMIISFHDTIITGSYFCEKNKIFEDWKDKSNFDCFYNISQLFKKNKHYELELPDDNDYIDYIIENNFRYFTCFDLFLPKNDIVLQPTCHTEVIIYAHNYEKIIKLANVLIEKHEGFSILVR